MLAARAAARAAVLLRQPVAAEEPEPAAEVEAEAAAEAVLINKNQNRIKNNTIFNHYIVLFS